MGPVRRKQKRRRMATAADAAAAESGDWWDGFSLRLAAPLPFAKAKNGFESVFKISRKTFDYICSLVREDYQGERRILKFGNGTVLSVEDLVAVALIRLTSGESLLNIGTCFGMNHSRVQQITWRFVDLMEERAAHHLQWPSSEEMEGIKSKFEKIGGLPNCCGAIDATHVMLCMSADQPSSRAWFDKEEKHSMTVQVIVDANMRFRDVVAGWPGKMDESLVLQSSGFYKLCEQGLRLNSRVRSPGGLEVGDYIVGDAAYPSLPWLMTPYQEKDCSLGTKAEFNKRHAAAHAVVVRTLAMLKDTWRVLQGELWRPDLQRLPRMIYVCCLLHNIILDLEGKLGTGAAPSVNHDDNYRQQSCGEVDGKEGFTIRDCLAQYVSRLPS